MKDPNLSDPGAESAVVGYLLNRGFDKLPPGSIISPQCFTTEPWRAIYAAAYLLQRAGHGVARLSIRKKIDETPHLLTALQEQANNEGRPEWRDILHAADESLVYVPEAVRDCLHSIRDCALRRDQADIAKRMQAGEIEPAEAFAELQETLRAHSSDADALCKLDERRIRLTTPPAKPVPVFTLNEQNISTAGNLTVISAQAKAGKTATVGAMLAAILAADAGDNADCFGFQGTPTNGKAVLFFDTEQSPWDAYCLARRAADRAEITELPEAFRGYYLLDIPTDERRRFLSAELERASAECGGIHAVLLDGAGDLCVDVNDPAESNDLVAELIALAVKHCCPIITVLHENPGENQSGKTRGHLGSQLERKAESNLRILKDDDGVSTIYSGRCRHASFPKNEGPRFAWNDATGRHETIFANPESKNDKRREELKPEVEAIFEDAVGAIRYADLSAKIASVCGIKAGSGTILRRIREYTALGMMKKTQFGYELSR